MRNIFILVLSFTLSACSNSNDDVGIEDVGIEDDSGQPSNNGVPSNNGGFDGNECSTDEECHLMYKHLEGGNDGPYDSTALVCKQVDGSLRCVECNTPQDCPTGWGCNGYKCYPIKQICTTTSECPTGFYCEDRDRCLPIIGYDMGMADAGTSGDMALPLADMGTNSDMATD